MLTIQALASGSSGNAFLVETERVALLLDAGLSPRRIERYLEKAGVARERLAGIVLTHEHADHTSGAAALARKVALPLYATAGTLGALDLDDCDAVPVPTERPFMVGDVCLTPFAVPHDAAEPIGLLIEHAEARVALATDLGTVDEATADWLRLAELLILESNHDLDRLWRGPYPLALKRRIAGGRGHLSNDQAAHCIAHCAERGRLRWAWLAHLSETNNTQRAALQTVRARVGASTVSVQCLRRRQPSLVWRSTEAYLQAKLL